VRKGMSKWFVFKVFTYRNDVTFLYKLAQGVCPKSYGMNVGKLIYEITLTYTARMAGIAPTIVKKAAIIARQFEVDSNDR
jgi:DNA mismatch repair ATPase MutS